MSKSKKSKKDWSPAIEPKIGMIGLLYEPLSTCAIHVRITNVTKKCHRVDFEPCVDGEIITHSEEIYLRHPRFGQDVACYVDLCENGQYAQGTSTLYDASDKLRKSFCTFLLLGDQKVWGPSAEYGIKVIDKVSA